MIESELFGHEKGAFTGAVATRKGRFELAHGGTIFLDEIGEISPASRRNCCASCRKASSSASAASRRLRSTSGWSAPPTGTSKKLVSENKFRADLYYRINVVPLMLPPLRERPGDIAELALHFLNQYGEENGHALSFGPDATDVLTKCYFPGNVRELENCIRRTAAMTPADEIHASDFACRQGHCLSSMLWKGPASHESYTGQAPKAVQVSEPVAPPPAAAVKVPPEIIERNEAANGAVPYGEDEADANSAYASLSKDKLVKAMEKTGWVQAKAARILGLTPRQIGYALKKHGIEMKRY